MEMKELEGLSKGELIKAKFYGRRNFLNGKYQAGQVGLDDLKGIKNNDIFFLETMLMKADLADKIIAEAESQGIDTTDPNVMQKLGEKINDFGTPIHRNEAIMTGVIVSLKVIVFYGIAIGVWGIVFKKSFWVFGLYGVIAGLLISLLFIGPVIAYQRTKERIRDMVFGSSAMWGNLGIIIGVVGLVAWIISLIFF